MNNFQKDLIAIYKQLLNEVEGGSCDFTEVQSILNRHGIELDDDYWPIEDEI